VGKRFDELCDQSRTFPERSRRTLAAKISPWKTIAVAVVKKILRLRTYIRTYNGKKFFQNAKWNDFLSFEQNSNFLLMYPLSAKPIL
jgi:hypothetical protein